jgi:hypothetical protein
MLGESEYACFVPQLKVLFLITLEKVSAEMGEGCYKLGTTWEVAAAACAWSFGEKL